MNMEGWENVEDLEGHYEGETINRICHIKYFLIKKNERLAKGERVF